MWKGKSVSPSNRKIYKCLLKQNVTITGLFSRGAKNKLKTTYPKIWQTGFSMLENVTLQKENQKHGFYYITVLVNTEK